MANFEPKEFNASDINGGQKFRNGDGISAEAINAPIESALLMQRLATTQPQLIEDGGATSVSIDTTNNKFVFKNIKGEKGEQGEKGEKGEQGDGIPSNMSQNVNKTIVVDGSVVNGNWNATFISQQGGKQRPICTQYTNHTGAKAEMVATANSAKFKFVNGSTDPQSYMEVFEDKINFSKPITVQNKPVGGGSGGGDYYIIAQVVNLFQYYAYPTHYIVLPTNVSKLVLEKVVYMYASNNNTPYATTIEVNATLNNYDYVEIPYLNGVVNESYEWQYDETINVSFQYADGIFSASTSSELDDRLIKTSSFVFRVTP